MWYAKPSGGYTFSSLEGKSNIQEMYNYFASQGYTLEAMAGVIGNIMAESSLNPWRWQGDTVSYSGGYGLFQYTPASAYVNSTGSISQLTGFSPNRSVSAVTSGATPQDGYPQLVVYDTNMLGKWVSSAWRPYWDKTTYATLWSNRNRIVSTYGSNNQISQAQFKTIQNIYDATFIQLASFEGPLVPNMTDRVNYANRAYEILQEIGPVPPTPPTPSSGRMPIWMYLRPF